MDAGRSGNSVLARVLLILAVSAVLVAIAAIEGEALGRRSGGAYRVRSGRAPLPPVDGSTFIRSYPVTFNGLKSTFAHYTSRLGPEAVVKEYMRRAKDRGLKIARDAGPPGLTSYGAGCSALAYVTDDEATVGVIAFENPESGGSEYFVGSMATPGAGDVPARPEGDRPGREPPGVPKPARSTRVLCIENLGGLPSVLNLYEAWGRPNELAGDLSRAMADQGWTERVKSSEVLTQQYEGHALLSFARGHEQCIVGVDQERKSGKIVILMFWAERRWLPAGLAL